jgi:capsid protein
MATKLAILDASGNPIIRDTRREAAPQRRRANLTYDAARDSEEYRRHWANTDALDPDCANSRAVRLKLMHRSRYEEGSNGFYNGTIKTHSDLLVGIGPTLRMLTRNRNFNQVVERDFYKWSQRIQLRRKLWCMSHARTMDGEAFGLLQTNPMLPMGGVQLDLTLIEAEQCHTPYPQLEAGYIDGIHKDRYDNILWYDVLPYHPGAAQQFLNTEPIRVSPNQMLHWFKLKRPGEHRSVPSMTSTLNLGASARRMREATLRKAEIQADFSVLLESTFPPDPDDQQVSAWTTQEIDKGMMTMLPDGMKSSPLTVDTPSAEYGSFNRGLRNEESRPLGQPLNLTLGDSSTYSFASGKLDFIAYRTALNIEREDCNDLVLDPLFEEWFEEWSVVGTREDGPPTHQWDWPAHPVIDAVAEAEATNTKLKNGTIAVRDVYTDQSQDFEDKLQVMAEDTFGEASEENIEKMRKIIVLKNTPEKALPFVAQLLGVELPQTAGAAI